MSRIGVMQVVLSLHPGGTERLVIEIVRRLGARFRMSVCCLDDRGAWAPQVESFGVPTVACGRRGGFRPALSRRIAALARREQVDVLHCHHYTPFVYGALASYQHPRPAVVFTEHGRLSNQTVSIKRRIANALLARVPSEVCAVSSDLARDMEADGFHRRPIRIVHNGIDPGPATTAAAREGARQALGVDADAFVIATVARLDPVKDLGTLLRAFERVLVHVPASRLVIVGDGPERTALEALAKVLRVHDRVCFTGARGDARYLLAGADAYVNSSVTEGISLTILEALAAGLPVVATRAGGTPEIIDSASHPCGILVPPGDASAIAAALRQLAEASSLRLRLGAAGRRCVEERFTLDTMIDTYADAYERAGGA